MNRTVLVATTLAAAVAVFGAAAFFISSDAEAPTRTVATTETSASEASAATPGEGLLVRAHSPVLGGPDAPVTLVEFFDPACEACRAFHPTVKKILADNPGNVRLVVRYMPFHGKASETAVAILEAARMQGVFEPVMDAPLERQREWASHSAPAAERALTIAMEAGLDVEAAEAQMMSPMTFGIMNADRADVEAVGVRGTPTFFVNGKPLEEFGEAELIEAVEREVAATRAD